MNKKTMKKCKGIIGLVFGHNYKPVYDEDIEYLSADEKLSILEKESKTLAPLYRHLDGGINPVTQAKRITKILKGHLCSRCGDFNENKLNII